MLKRKPIEIPPQAARQFIAEMKAYHTEPDDFRRDEIAVKARHMLLDYMPDGTKLRLTEVIELFNRLRKLS